MPCTSNETPLPSTDSSFSPPESTSALSSAPEQVDNYLWPNLEKQHRDEFYPEKKKIYFLLIAWKDKIFFWTLFFLGKWRKDYGKRTYSCAKWYMCVSLEEFHNLLVEKLSKYIYIISVYSCLDDCRKKRRIDCRQNLVCLLTHVD